MPYDDSEAKRLSEMKSYRLVEYNSPLVEQEIARPTPHGREVLVKVKAAGVCHSDIHIWHGGYDLGNGKFLSFKERGIKLPMTMGHETVGVVDSVGEKASTVSIGRNYLVYPWIGCGECDVCKSGHENLCNKPRCLGVHRSGGYAEFILVPDEKYLIEIGDLDPAVVAPYACSGLTTYSAIKKIGADVYKAAPVVIFGAGGLGLMCISLLKALGAVAPVVVDIDEKKRAAALENGAAAVVDGNAKDATEQIIRSCGGEAPMSAIDFVGAPSTGEIAFNALGRGGKLVMVGLFGGASRWPLPLIPMKGVTIFGNYVGNLAECQELMALVRAKSVHAIPIERYPLGQADVVLGKLRAGEIVGRGVLTA